MAEGKQVLVVEDERKLAEVLVEYLEQSGFRTHWLADGLAVVDWVRDNAPDLILLDLMLPGRDGMGICREVRKFSTVPVIMVTARVEEIDRLLGLEIGADDYICKPYSPLEVVALVRAIFRRIDYLRAGPGPAEEGFTVDHGRLVIRVQGQVLELTLVEFRLLAALLEQPGRVFSRDQLLGRLYADHRVVGDRTVDSHIKNIRKKIAQVLPGREVVASIYGVGYKVEW